MERKFIGGCAISTVKYGNVFETSVLNKYGEVLAAHTDFTLKEAKCIFDYFAYVCGKESNYEQRKLELQARPSLYGKHYQCNQSNGRKASKWIYR